MAKKKGTTDKGQKSAAAHFLSIFMAIVEWVKKQNLFRTSLYVMVLALWIAIISCACNFSNIVERVADKVELYIGEKHDILQEHRMTVNASVDDALFNLAREVGATEGFVFEFHNGTNNPSGLPFFYMNLSYEYINYSVHPYHQKDTWMNIPITQYPFISKHYQNKFFIGTTDEVAEIDPQLYYRLKAEGIEYVACMILCGVQKPLGIIGVGSDSPFSYENWEVMTIMNQYSQSISTLLDAQLVLDENSKDHKGRHKKH